MHGDCWSTHCCSQLMVNRGRCCVVLLQQHRAVSLWIEGSVVWCCCNNTGQLACLPTACVPTASSACSHYMQLCRRKAFQTLQLLSTAVCPSAVPQHFRNHVICYVCTIQFISFVFSARSARRSKSK